jgi:6-phosphogluconolactonase
MNPVQLNPVQPFASIQAMAVFCHHWLQKTLEALPNDQVFSIALSGGSTPAALFDALVALEKTNTAAGQLPLPWQKVHFFWGDERCVPPDHPDSNYRMTKNHLLHPLGIPANQIHRVRGENEPFYEAVRYAAHLSSVLTLVDGYPRFDLVVLGLGDDGHTASLFPGHEALFDTNQLCQAVAHPVSGQARVTLTGSLINRASTVAFLVTGAGKASMVATVRQQAAALEHQRVPSLDPLTTTATLPAALVAPVDGRLCWLLDEAAAGLQRW